MVVSPNLCLPHALFATLKPGWSSWPLFSNVQTLFFWTLLILTLTIAACGCSVELYSTTHRGLSWFGSYQVTCSDFIQFYNINLFFPLCVFFFQRPVFFASLAKTGHFIIIIIISFKSTIFSLSMFVTQVHSYGFVNCFCKLFCLFTKMLSLCPLMADNQGLLGLFAFGNDDTYRTLSVYCHHTVLLLNRECFRKVFLLKHDAPEVSLLHILISSGCNLHT